jgi:hypothetical protein
MDQAEVWSQFGSPGLRADFMSQSLGQIKDYFLNYAQYAIFLLQVMLVWCLFLQQSLPREADQ